MASSHHLMTVCMFCLLCATHTSCSAHDGVLPSGQNLRKLQDLKHEKFKMKDIATDSIKDQNNNLQKLPKPETFDFVLSDSNSFSSGVRKSEVFVDNVRTFSPFRLSSKFKEMRRRKREMAESQKIGDMPTAAQSVEYKTTLKNIDVDFYIKKLFIQFGDRETMTMDLEGFDRMLKKLDLDRMVVEAGILENGTNVQKYPVETVINGVRSNSTNVNCVNSIDLVSSIKSQSRSHRPEDHKESHKNGTVNQTLSGLKSSILLNAQTLTKLCPILLYQKVSNTSYERHGCVVDREFPKSNSLDDEEEDQHYREHHLQRGENRTTVWIYSSLCILLISLCGLLGVVVIPIMDHVYYQQILQFLVALAVGTLSGDALLHLLPHAISPDVHNHEHSHGDAHSHSDSIWKGLVAMVGVVFFYFTEKFLNLITEWRKKKMRANKENKLPSRVRVMRNDIGCLRSSGSCSSHTGRSSFLKFPDLPIFKSHSENKEREPNRVPSSGKICKHKYSEYPYCYDEITTDTLDDHHHRDLSKNSSSEKVNNKKKSEESPLSVVSLNVLNNHKENNSNEPGVNDALLGNDSAKPNNAVSENNALQKKQDFPISMGFNVENCKKEEPSNGGKRRSGVKIMDGHLRSRSADRVGELGDIDIHKGHQKESYTVILREHSQSHHGHSHSHGHVHSPPSSMSSVVWMVIMGDGLHNFTDGMAIGAAFSANIAGGFSTAIAVLCHELPHEIGDFAVLLKAGMSAKRAVCYNLLSSILCLFGMMVGICAGHTPEASAWIFAAAAGMFLYIALVDMIPELSSSHSNEGGSLCQCLLQLSGFVFGIGIMLLIAMYEDHLKSLFE